jgi:hypothetical protein
LTTTGTSRCWRIASARCTPGWPAFCSVSFPSPPLPPAARRATRQWQARHVRQ